MIKSTYSGRGAGLESRVNAVNELYRNKGLALVQKIPTPITPVKQKGSVIVEAFFEKKSTVDYIGAVQGIPVCFDAKECKGKKIPLSNFKEHQIAFMEDFEKQNGIAFFLVYFSSIDEYYYLPLRDFISYKETHTSKSIAPEEMRIRLSSDVMPAHYLPGIQEDIKERELT